MVAGEQKAKPKRRHAEDTEIASSIRNAMSHLRAGSLPAALVRPSHQEAEDSDPQARNYHTHMYSQCLAALYLTLAVSCRWIMSLSLCCTDVDDFEMPDKCLLLAGQVPCFKCCK